MVLDKKYSIFFFVLFVFFMFFKPAICSLMLGTVTLFYAISSILSLNKMNKYGIENSEKIISYESDNEGYKTPIIEYQVDEVRSFKGKPFLHTSSDLDKFQSYHRNINKTIKIIYDPDYPEKFILKDNYNIFGFILTI